MVIFHSFLYVYQRVKSIESQSKDFLFLFPNKKDDLMAQRLLVPPHTFCDGSCTVEQRCGFTRTLNIATFSQWCIRIKDLNRRKFMTNAGSVGWWAPNCFAEGNSNCRLKLPTPAMGGKLGRQDSLISRVAIHLLWDIYCSSWIPMMYHPAVLFSGEIPFISISWVLCLIFFLISKDVMCQVVQMNSRLLPSNSHFWFPRGNLWNMSLTSGNHCQPDPTNLKTVPW